MPTLKDWCSGWVVAVWLITVNRQMWAAYGISKPASSVPEVNTFIFSMGMTKCIPAFTIR